MEGLIIAGITLGTVIVTLAVMIGVCGYIAYLPWKGQDTPAKIAFPLAAAAGCLAGLLPGLIIAGCSWVVNYFYKQNKD